jgi:hypothetical protein
MPLSEVFQNGVHLFDEIGPVFIAFWTVAILALFIARFCRPPFVSTRFPQTHFWVLTHLSFSLAALVIGAIAPRGPLPPFPMHQYWIGPKWLYFLLWGSFLSAAFWIWRMKGFRLFASALMLAMQIPTLLTILVASLQSSGDL